MRYYVDQKAFRFEFARFMCAKCSHTQVIMVRIGQQRVCCGQCGFPHAIQPNERRTDPNE